MKILRALLFFFLFFLVGLFSGIQFANIIEAGKGQMLAGGAIVLGYGLVGAVIGLITSIFIFLIYKSQTHVIVRFNRIMVVLVVCFWIFFYLRYQTRQAERNERIGCLTEVDSVKFPNQNDAIKLNAVTL